MNSAKHFRKVIRRENVLKNGIHNVFMSMASFSRLLFEVFTRHDFGERYFRLSAALTLILILAFFPLIPSSVASLVSGNFSLIPSAHYITWYMFLAAHVYLSIGHFKDKNLNRANATKVQYSLFSGYFNNILVHTFSGEVTDDSRFMETVLEPALFAILGIVLMIFGQSLGYLLLINSIIYAIGYMAAYKEGDDFVMDTLDESIAKEAFYRIFISGENTDTWMNYRFVGRIPEDENIRKRIGTSVQEQEKVSAE